MAKVSFYGKGQGVLGGNPIRRDYDSRLQMADQLMRQGASPAPVQSPLEGLARALTAGVGGYFGGEAEREMKGREAQYGQDMATVMAGGAAKPWINPDTGQEQGTAGGYEGMASALSKIDNPDMAGFGQQISMAQMQQEQAARQAEIARQNALADYRTKAKIDAEFSGGDPTSNMRDYAERVRLVGIHGEGSPQVLRFDDYVSSTKLINQGGTMGVFDPSNPSTPAASLPVTPKPEQMPTFKAEVATAEAEAKAEAERNELAVKNVKVYGAFDVAMKGVEDAFSKLKTDPVTGLFPAMTEGAQIADASTSLMAPALKSMFRDAGEGTFSEGDQKLLLNMAPKRTDHPSVVKWKTNQIREIVAAKLGQGDAATPPPKTAGTMPPPPPGFE